MNAQSAHPEDDRLHILRMVEEGKISAGEGISLLEALEHGRKPARNPSHPALGAGNTSGAGNAGGSPRWLRVRVTDLYTGRTKPRSTSPLA